MDYYCEKWMHENFEERVKALASFIDVDFEEESVNRAKEFLENGEYLVLTDDEANEYVEERIKESAWAFNADFILEHTKVRYNYNDETLRSLKAVQESCCESCNELILALINDIDEFIYDAIMSDGRGHFIADYDGIENEVEGTFKGQPITYYIYRI